MISNITLKNFRKYSNFSLDIKNNLVILVGRNAIGKTTILESIYLSSKAKSHKTNDLKELIKENNEFGICDILNNNAHYKMILSKNGRKALINNVEYKKISDYIGNIKAIMFSPNDLNLIYGSKSERRQFMDVELSIIDKNYIRNIQTYKKLLSERNELLKVYSPEKKTILNVITTELIDCCKKIIKYRSDFINDLGNYLSKIHKNLYDEDVFIKYLPNVNENNIEEIFESKLDYDIITKTTNHGIHRDDFSFTINGKKAETVASQGQVRSIVLSLKLALFYKLKNEFGNNIILLLDDVFSELDINRGNSLVRFLLSENQTFISTTNIDFIPDKLKSMAQIVYLEKE